MRLVVTTPTAIAVNEDPVRYVRAEDFSGAFGIEPGHADFLTVLAISVVMWRDRRSVEHYVAVRGGVLRVREGKAVEIATREAVVDTDLKHLRSEVVATMMKDVQAEQSARCGTLALERAAIRRIYQYLRPADRPFEGKPPRK